MSPSQPEYTVAVSEALRERLRQLSDVAAADGRIDSFLAALATITQRLQTTPEEFGEELYDLRGLRLTVKASVVLPIAVEFSIHPNERVVFVSSFRYVKPGDLPPSGPERNGSH